MRKVPVTMLTPDMILGRPVCIETQVLLNAGIREVDRYQKRLLELGVNYVYVEDHAGDGIEIDDLITLETRMKCKKTLQSSFKRLHSQFAVDVKELSTLTEDLIGEILNRKSMLYNLNEIGGIGDNTLDHSLNTTIYAICLGTQLQYSTGKLRDLAMGTLLHDIGKTALNHNILFKPGKLTEEEFEHVKSHTILGYKMLCKDMSLPETTRQVCLSHHERMDGSGYPNGSHGKDLSEFVKIASIVDVYEALTVNRCYHSAVTPAKAMEILTEDAVSKLDFPLVSTFIQNIEVYPNGTTVLLSDGNYAVIKHQNTSLPLRPVVRVIKMENGKCIPQYEIDLMTTLNITIIDSNITIPAS